MRRGRQNFELKLFGCKNVPYVGQINVRWWGEKYLGVQKAPGGAQEASGGAKKLQGAQEAYNKNRKNSGDLFFFFFFFFFLGDSKKITLQGRQKFQPGGAEWKTWLTLRHCQVVLAVYTSNFVSYCNF